MWRTNRYWNNTDVKTTIKGSNQVQTFKNNVNIRVALKNNHIYGVNAYFSKKNLSRDQKLVEIVLQLWKNKIGRFSVWIDIAVIRSCVGGTGADTFIILKWWLFLMPLAFSVQIFNKKYFIRQIMSTLCLLFEYSVWVAWVWLTT